MGKNIKSIRKTPNTVDEPTTTELTPEQAVVHVVDDKPIINEEDEKEIKKKTALEIEHNLKDSMPEKDTEKGLQIRVGNDR